LLCAAPYGRVDPRRGPKSLSILLRCGLKAGDLAQTRRRVGVLRGEGIDHGSIMVAYETSQGEESWPERPD